MADEGVVSVLMARWRLGENFPESAVIFHFSGLLAFFCLQREEAYRFLKGVNIRPLENIGLFGSEVLRC